MDSAMHTRDSITLLRRTWAEPLRRLTSEVVERHRVPGREKGTSAPARQLASSDRGLVLLVQMAGARCAALADVLTAAGYDVQVAQGLPAAVASLARRTPALVVVDGQANQALYRNLRQAGAFVMLALMVEPTDEQMLAAFAAGVDDSQ